MYQINTKWKKAGISILKPDKINIKAKRKIKMITKKLKIEFEKEKLQFLMFICIVTLL